MGAGAGAGEGKGGEGEGREGHIHTFSSLMSSALVEAGFSMAVRHNTCKR